MSVQIKICGITRVEDAQAAIELGAAMLGLNFYVRSPRCIALPQAQEIARVVAFHNRKAGCGPVSEATPGPVKLVGVFVNMNVAEVLRIARAVPLDAVQLHGDESPDDCLAIAADFNVIRALRVDANFSAERAAEFATCRGLLFDTPTPAHGGSGECFDWNSVDWDSVSVAAPKVKKFLAGGLHAGNVGEAIAVAHPDAVDVCSGVESAKGIKDMRMMRAFVAAVRAAERQEQ